MCGVPVPFIFNSFVKMLYIYRIITEYRVNLANMGTKVIWTHLRNCQISRNNSYLKHSLYNSGNTKVSWRLCKLNLLLYGAFGEGDKQVFR